MTTAAVSEDDPLRRCDLHEDAFRQAFESAAQRDKVAAFAVEANEQNLDRLEAELTGAVR